jgi:hypothetical protein
MATTRREWLTRWFGTKRLDERASRDERYPGRAEILHRQKYSYRVPVQQKGYHNLNLPDTPLEDEDALWKELEEEDEK